MMFFDPASRILRLSPQVYSSPSIAALTYVAAAITAMLQMLYFVMRMGLLGGND